MCGVGAEQNPRAICPQPPSQRPGSVWVGVGGIIGDWSMRLCSVVKPTLTYPPSLDG